ncbi:MAG TPA: hypothetical protein DCY88_27350 [Cyanobacteria bacterium UBA11372]|nr:hypothetical protein [Cyanobacteria bacterium UBA11372]
MTQQETPSKNFYSGLQIDRIHFILLDFASVNSPCLALLRLCSGSINAAATQTRATRVVFD